MGEVIGIVLILVIVVVLIGGGLTFAVRITKPDPSAVESPQFRNHMAMARWIEHAVTDDMVRVTLAPEKQQTAKKLLDEFYRENG
jgi:flagellar basal body-associated protein FliL